MSVARQQLGLRNDSKRKSPVTTMWTCRPTLDLLLPETTTATARIHRLVVCVCTQVCTLCTSFLVHYNVLSDFKRVGESFMLWLNVEEPETLLQWDGWMSLFYLHWSFIMYLHVFDLFPLQIFYISCFNDIDETVKCYSWFYCVYNYCIK